MIATFDKVSPPGEDIPTSSIPQELQKAGSKLNKLKFSIGPNLKTSEHLWGELKRYLASSDVVPGALDELWQQVTAQWSKLTIEACQKPIMSIPTRIRVVLQAKIDYTKD
ncbi:unnamed protein product [Ceratitis capitata]|uniref:(Mediterranean fruit fly) hypothetical protein n=1 Tax=Ceratitis capitata TaxID=7213 RepID=A0A811UUM5_CERCA|nr:unnamed protein product [Ceratitis capitata]